MKTKYVIRDDLTARAAVQRYGKGGLAKNCTIDPSYLKELAKYLQGRLDHLPKLSKYKPHPKQAMFHASRKRFRAAYGGNRSGKSYCGVVECCFHLLREYPSWWRGWTFYMVPKLRIRVCAPSLDRGIMDVIHPYFKALLPKNYIVKTHKNSSNQITGFDTVDGDEVRYMSYKQDIEDFESASYHICWEDEPPSRAIHNANVARLAENAGAMMVTATVLRRHAWLYDDIDPETNNDCFTIEMSTRDNPVMTDEKVEAMERLILSEDERLARIEGKPMILAGVIFKEFNVKLHVVPRFDTMNAESSYSAPFTHYMGIDPHPRKSWAMAWYAVNDKGQLYVIDEAHQNIHTIKAAAITAALKERRITEDQALTVYDWDDAVAQKFLYERFNKPGTIRIWARIIDTSANAPNMVTGDPVTQELARWGIYCVAAKKDLDSGMALLHGMLKPTPAPMLFVMDNCAEHIWQFEHYTWDEYATVGSQERHDPMARPRKKRDDFMDLLRYVALYNPQYRMERSSPWLQPHRVVNRFAGI